MSIFKGTRRECERRGDFTTLGFMARQHLLGVRCGRPEARDLVTLAAWALYIQRGCVPCHMRAARYPFAEHWRLWQNSRAGEGSTRRRAPYHVRQRAMHHVDVHVELTIARAQSHLKGIGVRSMPGVPLRHRASS